MSSDSDNPTGLSLEKEGLFMKVAIRDGFRYVCAYRSVFIATNDESQDNNVKLGPDTIVIRVDSSAASPRNIEVYCEELVLAGGTTYQWLEKSVLIRCRKLVWLENSPNAIAFNLSGKDGAVPASKEATSPSDEQTTASRAIAPGLTVNKREEYITGYMTSMKDTWHEAIYDTSKGSTAAKAGGDGSNGEPGKRGTDAGDFNFFVEVVDNSVLSAGNAIHINVNGGKGGDGQNGQDGFPGGAGLDFPCADVRFYVSNKVEGSFWDSLMGNMRPSNDVFVHILQTFHGAVGGKGGNGGPGGLGGSSGAVRIAPATLGAVFKIEKKCGDAGKPGGDGSTGATGKHSESNVFQQSGLAMWSWSNYADTLHGDENKGKRDLCSSINNWSRNKTEPPLLAGPSVTHLDGENLWKLYESKRQAATQDGTQSIQDVASQDLHRAYAQAPSFLERLMLRLKFEHFVHFTSQQYPAWHGSPGAGELQAMTQLRESMEWIMSVFKDLNPDDNAPMMKSLRLGYASLAHAYLSSPTVDAFNNSVTFVPFVPTDHDFEQTIKNFQFVEDLYAESAGMLGEKAQQRAHLQKKIYDAQAKINESTKSIKDYEDKAAKLEKTIESSRQNVNKAISLLEKSMEAVQEKIESNVECKFDRIMETLSTAMMFTDFENPVAVAGAALSIDASVASSVNDAINKIGGVDKSLLYARMKAMTKEGKELKNEIATTQANATKEQEIYNDLRTSIVTSRAKFDTMCDQYLTEIDATDDTKRRFNTLIKAIDRKNKLQRDYNAAILDVVKARIAINEQETLIAGLGSSKAALTDDELQFASLFMSRAYEDMGRFALRMLYARVRAFNCVALAHSRAFDVLSPLRSFSGITAKTLKVAVDTALRQDFADLLARWATTSGASRRVVLTMTEIEHPILFFQFRETRSIMFDIDWAQLAPSFGDEAVWDVRLVDMSVFLVGAKVDRSKQQNPPVQLHIDSHGTFRYRDSKYKVHVFDLPPTHSSFLHQEVIGEDSPDSAFERVGNRIAGETLQLNFLKDQHDPVPLQSPLGVWTIEAVPGSDLTDCRAIRFEFEVTYRV